MQKVEYKNSQRDHHPLENKEQSLVFNQATFKPLCHLDNTIDGADHNADGAQSQRTQERAKLLGGAELCVCLVELVLGFQHAVCVLCTEGHEKGEGEDLEAEAG